MRVGGEEVTRSFARRAALLLFRHSISERYPTRTVEHMLAWVLLVWSASLALPGNMMRGPAFEYLLLIAPEWWWGAAGVVISTMRLVALYVNGNWHRTPGLRFIGAMTGLIWWLVISALYALAVAHSAPDFPMRLVFLVFVFFEAYSCYRCGQDHAAPKARDAGAPDGGAGNG